MVSKALWICAVIVALTFILLPGCKIKVTVPEGGRVVSESGAYDVPKGQALQISVVDIFFDETFTAVPAPGYAFAGWRRSPRYFCGESRDPCHLSTLNFGDFPALMSILASDEEFWLEPLFVREDVLVYRNGSSLLKVSFNGDVSEITESGSPAFIPFSLSPDGSRVAYRREGSIEDQRVLEIVSLDTLSLESRVTGLDDNYWRWLGNSETLLVITDSGLARIDAGNDMPIILLETPTPMPEGTVDLRFGGSSADGNRLTLSMQFFEPLGIIPTETRIYTYEYGDPEAQLFISSVSTNSNDLRFSWSPDNTTLVYQARHEHGPIYPTIPSNSPAGPLMARLADGSTRIIYDPETDNQGRDLRLWAWLSKDQMLLRSSYSFEIRNLEGETQLVMDGRLQPFPHLGKIAFWADNAVHLLELDTAESELLGPGAIDIDTTSTLKWSPDGRFLTWNYWEFVQSEDDLLYTHDHLTGTTELFRRMVRYGRGGDFKWSHSLNLLNYIDKDGDQFKHLIRNPLNGKQAVVREGIDLRTSIRDLDLSLWKDSVSSVYTGILPHLTIRALREKFSDQTVRLMPSPSGDHILIQEFNDENPEWYLHLIGTSTIEPVNGTSGVPLRSQNFKFLY